MIVDPSTYKCLQHGKTREELETARFRLNKNRFHFDVSATKAWFDYRFLHPVEATMVFLTDLQTAHRRVARQFDIGSAEHRTLVSPMAFFDKELFEKNKATLNAAWKVRQIADFLGVPYPEYLLIAFDMRLKYWKRSFIPHINNLMGDMIVETVHHTWHEKQKGRLYLADHPNYTVEKYRGAPAQEDYHRWLIKQAEFRANPVEYLARFVRENGLPISKVDKDLRERVLGYAS